jgi:transcriptional regulator with XRE-family HTH domain
MFMNKNNSVFHSGKRLLMARQSKGFMQEEIIDQTGFPSIDPRTLRDWEKDGIPYARLPEVADFFKLPLWCFKESKITEQDFMTLLLHPDQIDGIKEKVLAGNGTSNSQKTMMTGDYAQNFQAETVSNEFHTGLSADDMIRLADEFSQKHD